MLVKFRHGVIKQRRDDTGEPSSIYVDGNFFRLFGTKKDPYTFTVSFEKFDYLHEVDHSNLTWEIEPGIWYLYLNVDFLTGVVSCGKSNLPVFYTDNEPQNVQNGQHWYDVNDSTMRVFEDGVWKDTLRLFIGRSDGRKIFPARVGSNMVSETPIRPLYPVLDTFGYPMRVRRSTDKVGSMTGFQGSITKDLSKSRTLVRMGDFLVGATASTRIQKFGLVHLLPGNKVKFSDATDPLNRVVGMVVDGANLGDELDIKTFGFVKNPEWNWSDAEISRPVFSDGAGNVVTLPPDTGVNQQVGFVLSTDSIFLDIKRPIILTLPRQSYAFVPGDLKPSVVISYKKTPTFVGSELTYGWETEPLKIFNGGDIEYDFQTEPQSIFAPGKDISYSFNLSDQKIFSSGSDILISFGVVDMFAFGPGTDIKLLDFEDYNQRVFSGDRGEILDFNTSLQNVLTPDNVRSIVGATIYDLFSFTPGTDQSLVTFNTTPLNVFVPSEEIIFYLAAQDLNVLTGKFGGGFSFASTTRRIFGTTQIEQRITFSSGSGVRIFTSGSLRQIVKFSA